MRNFLYFSSAFLAISLALIIFLIGPYSAVAFFLVYCIFTACWYVPVWLLVDDITFLEYLTYLWRNYVWDFFTKPITFMMIIGAWLVGVVLSREEGANSLEILIKVLLLLGAGLFLMQVLNLSYAWEITKRRAVVLLVCRLLLTAICALGIYFIYPQVVNELQESEELIDYLLNTPFDQFFSKPQE